MNFMKKQYVVWLTLYLTMTLVTNQSIFGQTPKSDKPNSESIIQYLLNSRKAEHWDFRETQLVLTPAPFFRPVQAIPEWDLTGYVMFALDERLIQSLEANVIYELQNKEDAIKRYDPELAKGELFKKLQAESESYKKALFDLLGLAHTFLKVMREASKYTPVLLLVPSDDLGESEIHFLADLIKTFPGGMDFISSQNVNMMQLPIDTQWIRDYGPIFVRDANNRIICVDSRYHTARQSQEEKRKKESEEQILQKMTTLLSSAKKGSAGTYSAGTYMEARRESSNNFSAGRLLDDISPSILAGRLRQTESLFLSSAPLTVVRPPIALDGGDFLTDGKGVGFTSTSTLALNGGDSQLLDVIFKEYFGIQNMIYLQPLPGSTIKHIDMFLKFVSPEIILIGRYENIGSNKITMPLQLEAQRVLEYNLNIIKNFYEQKQPNQKVNVIKNGIPEIRKGEMNIICVPMPDISRPALEELEKIKQELKEIEQDEKVKKFLKVDEQIKILKYIAAYLAEILDDLAISKTNPFIDSLLIHKVAVQLKSIADDWQLAHQSNLNLAEWNVLYEKISRFADFAQRKKTSSGHILTKQEQQILSSNFEEASSACEELLNQMDKSIEEIKKSFTKYRLELIKRLVDLEIQLRGGSDIYRTFLNSLYVRTSKSNLLLFPVYTGLDPLQKRVQEMLHSIYSQQYGELSIVSVDSDYLITMSGTIHCLTQTIPDGVHVFANEWGIRSNQGKK
jgi:agmatine/peptidylarginine deiminase